MNVFHLQKISENFYWEFPFGKSVFHLPQVAFEGAKEGLAA